MRRFFSLLAACAAAAIFACSGTSATSAQGGATQASSSASTSAGGTSFIGAGGFVVDAGDDGASCSDAGLEGGDGCGGSLPTATFAADIAPIFAGCAGELCHAPPSYDSVVGKRSVECCDGRLLVAPSDALRSYLLDKVRGIELCGGAPMPLGGPMLKDAELQKLTGWICAGAKND